MLAVLVQHDTGHGEASNLAYLSDVNDHVTDQGLIEAITVARNIQSYGYEFYGNDIGAYVIRVWPNQGIAKNQQEYVFIRRFYNKKWTEVWIDQGARERFEKLVTSAQ